MRLRIPIALIALIISSPLCFASSSPDPLIEAVVKKDSAAVSRLIAASHSLKVTNEQGISVLGLAVTNGNLDIVRILLDAGADLNIGTAVYPPLFLAVMKMEAGVANKSNYEQIFDLLLSRGADPKVRAGDGSTLLHAAASSKSDAGFMKRLISLGLDINAQDDEGDTALIKAMWRRSGLDHLSLLLDKGADPNIRGNGTTALLVAASAGNLDYVKLLAEKGGRLDIWDSAGNNPLTAAIVALDFAKTPAERSKSENNISYFLQRSELINAPIGASAGDPFICDPIPPLIASAYVNVSGNTTSLLLAKGARIDDRLTKNNGFGSSSLDSGFYEGMTALMMAAMMGRKDVASTLVAAGADLSLRTRRDGMTAAMLACAFDHHELLEMLLKNGGTLSTADLRICRTFQANSFRKSLEDALRDLQKQLDRSPATNRRINLHGKDGLQTLGISLPDDQIQVVSIARTALSYRIVLRHGGLTAANSKPVEGLGAGEGLIGRKYSHELLLLPEVAVP